MERALLQYSQNVGEKPFDIKVVPTAEPSEPSKSTSEIISMPKSVKPSEKPAASRQDLYSEQLSAIPEFAHLGPLFKSSSPIELTEPETEYSIKCVKHTFTNYIVFQVNKCYFFHGQKHFSYFVSIKEIYSIKVRKKIKRLLHFQLLLVPHS